MAPAQAGPAWTPMDAYSFAWKLVTKRFGAVAVPLVVGGLVAGAIAGVVYFAAVFGVQFMVERGLVDSSIALVLTYTALSISGLIILGISAFMAGGILSTALKAVRGQPTSIGDVFSGGRFALPFFVGLIVHQIVVTIGMMLCIVPGFILTFGLWLWGWILVDQGLSGVDALKKSWELTKGHKMNIFVFYLLGLLVYVAGELACVLPALLISMPMFITGSAWVYLKIKGEPVPEPT